MANPLTSHVAVTVCTDAQAAIESGFNWAAPTSKVKPIELKQCIVVRDGTEDGNSTVDFLVEDENGQQYVFMITGNLLKSIPC